MKTFGDRLKQTREERGLTLQDVAQILGVDRDALLALERNEFEALTDEAVVTNCLRAYADCLEVDANLMIEDYIRERDGCLGQLEDAIADRAVEIAPATIPATANRRPRFHGTLAASAILAAVATIAAWWTLPGDGTASMPREPVPATPSDNRVDVTLTVPESPAQESTRPTTTASILSIPEFDVGTAVENRRLVGRSDRFTEGTQVWFWTHVTGGSAGDRIDHVWLRDGVEAARIPLKLGGPRWRTQSAKKLHAGSAGNWVAEARDAAGHVLARSEFACVP